MIPEPTQEELDAIPLDWRYVHHVIQSLAYVAEIDPDVMADLATMILLNPDIHWNPAWKDEFDQDWKDRLMRGEATTPVIRERRARARAWAKVKMKELDAIGMGLTFKTDEPA